MPVTSPPGGGVDSSNNDDDFTLDYGLPITIKSVGYAGGVYKQGNFSASFYGSEVKDTWYQYYVNLKHRIALTDWTCPYKTGHQLPVKLMQLPSA
jgi:hypothetical protein